ncbi:MAG: Coenzyme F420 hydrogenase/dehydrogenase, beta subunit C-terminal domain, partial [Bacteroidaceae bacterium]|nr:Coenzyme F420 hydrogenase/dehydrogenase, beta subunit C-terminal domain [Bacteroidaceae bacterium]
MEPDQGGFLYPVIDENLCVNCGLCAMVCPALSPIRQNSCFSPRAFVMQNVDEEIREQSTSGGSFTAIAETVIDLSGVVYGAAMAENFEVQHTVAKSKSELEKFRNSKYVQSKIGDCFIEVKAYLKKKTPVLFSGTPCQINGLLKYIGGANENLLTVDLVCHSVPSPAVFRKYMEYQLKKFPNTKNVVFRDKKRGYDYSTMALYGPDKKGEEKCFYRKGSESDLWFRSFLPGLCDRENCYACTYQNNPRTSDITIWDCFTI